MADTTEPEPEDHQVPAGLALAAVAVVLICTAVGAAFDTWRKKMEWRGPRGWVIGLLLSSYALLIPGLVSHLFESKTDMFGAETVSQYDETTVSLVSRLYRQGMELGSILICFYSMVVPLVKLVLLVLAHYLRTLKDDASTLWAWRCVAVVQAVSKWASPDMFAYILLMYLIRGLDKPPKINSFMNLDLGFTCFCLFCVGSTVSSLGIRRPAIKDDGSARKKKGKPQVGPELAAVALLSVGFGVLFAVGLQKPSMSLHLDMDLMYKQRPDLLAMKDIIEGFNLPALLQMKVSVVQCIGALVQWSGDGEINCIIAFVLYLGFAVMLPALDMVLLLTGAVLHRSKKGNQAARVLKASHKVRKLAMLDVSIMGCFVVTMSLRSMRKNGVLVDLCPGVWYLLGAEVCHYAAGYVTDWTHARLVSAAEARNAKAGEVNETRSSERLERLESDSEEQLQTDSESEATESSSEE